MAKTASPKPPSATRAPAPKPTDGAPVILAHQVFINACTAGKRASLASPPLHEIPLLRRKVMMEGGDKVTLLGEWPSTVDRERPMTATDLREEYARLKDRYTFEKPGGRDGENVDLVADFYGPAHQGRLVAIMRKLHAGFQQMTRDLDGRVPTEQDLEELVKLADPDHDFDADGIPYEAASQA